MYAEFATDPDIQSLAFEDQRHYTVLLCMKCAGTLDKEYPTADRRYLVIRKTLGLDSVAVDECKRRLMEAGLIDQSWQPLGWDNRQFASDSSADRTRDWRERQKRLSDVTVTRSDSEAESIQKHKTRPRKRCPEEFAISPDLLAWAAQKVPGVNLEAETERFRDYEFKNAHTDWNATWREWMRKAFEKVGSVPHGTRRQSNGPRLSAVERVYAATAELVGDGDADRARLARDG